MQSITPSFLSRHPLPDHRDAGDKQERGRVLVIAGSVEIAGAGLLAALSALRAGAGILQVATCQTSASHLRMALPEALVVGCVETAMGGIDPSAARRLCSLAASSQAVLIGPGMTDDSAVSDLVGALLRDVEGPYIVLDASAFVSAHDHLELLKTHQGRILATPHVGEMAKFLGAERDHIEADPLACAIKGARLLGGVVMLKGAVTYIAGPDGVAWRCDHGCIGLGTSGSGDTLAGILTALLARGATPQVAACWSAYIHAEAGQRLTQRHGTVGFLAREIPGEVPRIMEDLRGS